MRSRLLHCSHTVSYCTVRNVDGAKRWIDVEIVAAKVTDDCQTVHLRHPSVHSLTIERFKGVIDHGDGSGC